MKHHNRYEAKKYAPRVTPEQRVKAFVLVGCVGSAPAGGRLGKRGAGWEAARGAWGRVGSPQEQLVPHTAWLGDLGEPGVDETPRSTWVALGGGGTLSLVLCSRRGLRGVPALAGAGASRTWGERWVGLLPHATPNSPALPQGPGPGRRRCHRAQERDGDELRPVQVHCQHRRHRGGEAEPGPSPAPEEVSPSGGGALPWPLAHRALQQGGSLGPVPPAPACCSPLLRGICAWG